MLGKFWYRGSPLPGDVVLELRWDADERRGRVHTPSWVFDHPVAPDLSLQQNDEYISLALAFSYGLLVAASAGACLTISGDRSAWPGEWGKLIDEDSCRPLASCTKFH